MEVFWRRQWYPTPVLLPGKSHGQRSLVGCSPWGRGESDTTEQLHFQFSLSCIGEGNGNPLQCSCLENPRDGGAWWAALSGVAQSRTRLKRLSSSSSSILYWCSSFWLTSLNMIISAAAAKSLQSCATLCDPTDGTPSGSPVPGILQARILEWVAISFSNAGKWKVKVKSLSRVRLPATPWTAAHQAPLSMGFSRQEYWSGWLLPSPGELPDPEREPRSPTLQADSLPAEPPGKPSFEVNQGGNVWSKILWNIFVALSNWVWNFQEVIKSDLVVPLVLWEITYWWSGFCNLSWL